MSNTRKWLLGCGAALVLGAIAIFAALFYAVSKVPRMSSARASVEMAAPVEAIRARLENLETWSEWSGWKRDVDPAVVRTFAGTVGRSGATMRWGAPPDVKIEVGLPRVSVAAAPAHSEFGRGEVRLVSSSEHSVEFHTVFEDGIVFAMAGRDGNPGATVRTQTPGSDYSLRSFVQFESLPGGARVTWSDDLNLGPGFTRGMLALVFGPASQAVHQEILEASLRDLKTVVENEAK